MEDASLRFEELIELVYVKGLDALPEQKVNLLLFDQMIVLCRPKQDSKWKLVKRCCLETSPHGSVPMSLQGTGPCGSWRDVALLAGCSFKFEDKQVAVDEDRNDGIPKQEFAIGALIVRAQSEKEKKDVIAKLHKAKAEYDSKRRAFTDAERRSMIMPGAT